MIQIMRAQKLGELLGRLREVVARYEKGRVDFAGLALEWLASAEELLREEQLPEATDVLTARTNVLAAKDRAQDQGKDGSSRRRAEALAAIDGLCVAEALLRKRLLAIEAHIDAYEEKLVEAVTALMLLGHMPPMQGVGRNAWTLQVWSALMGNDTTRPTATWLAAALSSPDRLFLLDRILLRVRSSELPAVVSVRDAASPREPVS